MKVKDLREAIRDVDDEMVVLLRVSNEDGEDQFMCSPSGAMPDPGCTDTECFMIDGTDGECEHGIQADGCQVDHEAERAGSPPAQLLRMVKDGSAKWNVRSADGKAKVRGALRALPRT